MSHAPNSERIYSATLTATATQKIVVPQWANGAWFLLNLGTVSGTSPTLDVKIQAVISGDFSDSAADVMVDLPGAAFAQKTATGDDTLEIYPGIGETANESVSSTLPKEILVVFTVGGTTPSFQTNLIVHWLR